MYFAESAPGRTIELEGEEYLFFSGTSYLGMAQNEQFKKYIIKGLEIYGTNYGSSRNSNLKFKIFEEAENKLASIAGAEAALTVSSGYLAGQLAVGMFREKTKFFYAPHTHPAIGFHVDNYYEGDFENWAADICGEVSSSRSQDVAIFANSLDPLFCKNYNFDWIGNLPKEKNITVVIDDSHGFGISGPEGGGIFSVLPKTSHVNILVTASLGKACGIPGGVIFSNLKTNKKLIKSPVFSGSSPVSPAYLYAFIQAEKEYEEARFRLFRNVKLLQDLILPAKNFQYLDNFPVWYSFDQSLYEYLLRRKIFISHFPYPAPESNPISRIVISSLHTVEDINYLAHVVQDYLKEI